MINKRNVNECRDYVGIIFSTLPKNVRDTSDIKSYLIANCYFLSGIHTYSLVFGKMDGDNFIVTPNEDGEIVESKECDGIIELISNGEVSIEQKFEHRHFSTIKLSKSEIKEILGKITLFN